MEKFAVKKIVIERTVVLLIKYLLVALQSHFEITIKMLYVRFMHKQKVTKLRLLK